MTKIHTSSRLTKLIPTRSYGKRGTVPKSMPAFYLHVPVYSRFMHNFWRHFFRNCSLPLLTPFLLRFFLLFAGPFLFRSVLLQAEGLLFPMPSARFTYKYPLQNATVNVSKQLLDFQYKVLYHFNSFADVNQNTKTGAN